MGFEVPAVEPVVPGINPVCDKGDATDCDIGFVMPCESGVATVCDSGFITVCVAGVATVCCAGVMTVCDEAGVNAGVADCVFWVAVVVVAEVVLATGFAVAALAGTVTFFAGVAICAPAVREAEKAIAAPITTKALKPCFRFERFISFLLIFLTITWFPRGPSIGWHSNTTERLAHFPFSVFKCRRSAADPELRVTDVMPSSPTRVQNLAYRVPGNHASIIIVAFI
jgi:hypothetical protein